MGSKYEFNTQETILMGLKVAYVTDATCCRGKMAYHFLFINCI